MHFFLGYTLCCCCCCCVMKWRIINVILETDVPRWCSLILGWFSEKMASWEHMGDFANIAQLTGVDAVKLIGMIVKAASTARMHKKNCRQFAMHLKLIGNLLEQLKISELKRYPETREPLEQLEDALRRSYMLVHSCQDRSYLYLLAMGWNIVYQFRKAQNEIDRYLRLVPLITLVDNARVRVCFFIRYLLCDCRLVFSMSTLQINWFFSWFFTNLGSDSLIFFLLE